jgi:hypothetical protein
MGYKASTRIKVSSRKEDDGEQYVEVGETVTKTQFKDDWDDLVLAKAVVEDEEFDRIHPELVEGVNQASGMPSNLEQITGTKLQVNPPEDTPDDKKAATAPEPRNPADVLPVKGAVEPGSGEDSHGQTVKEKDLPGADK